MGHHLFYFYENDSMLAKVLADFFLEGLRKGEYCMWIPRGGITQAEAVKLLKKHIPNIEEYIRKKQMHIVPFENWYLTDEGIFDSKIIMKKWKRMYSNVMKRGFAMVRIVGDASSILKERWDDIMAYEELAQAAISNVNVIAVCTYHGLSYKPDEIRAVLDRHFSSLAPH